MSIEVVLLSGARTPQGRVRGQLAALGSVELGAAAIAGALERGGVDADAVEHVIMGQVLPAGAGQNPARQAAIRAGIPWTVPSTSINRVCLSGVSAVIDAARMIRAGEASVIVAGGQESMTNAPHLLPGSRMGWAYGSVAALDHLEHDGLLDPYDKVSMGLSTERHLDRLGITRDEQDRIADASHRRAAAAQAEGLFADEVVGVPVPERRGESVADRDEGVRADSSVATLAGLRPAFDPEGSITAGNSSPISDGAAALVVADRAWAEANGHEWLAIVGAHGQVAGPDNSLHSQPSRAIERALDRAGWRVGDLDHIEINEAFAGVVVQSMRDLSVPHDIVNPHGGAIALGHPVGASGARLTLHAALELARRGVGRAAVSLCGGGGQGDALLLYR